MPNEKNTASSGRWKRFTFKAVHVETAPAAGALSLSEAITDTPTRTIDTYKIPSTPFRSGTLKRIKVTLHPTNAVTARLLILSTSLADDILSEMVVLFDSATEFPAGLAKDVPYEFTELDIPFILEVASTFYYILNYSAAAGNTDGYIHVSGEADP